MRDPVESVDEAYHFINARVMGAHIHGRAWELLNAMVVMEAAFGVAGVVAAPIFNAYLKNELSAKRLICLPSLPRRRVEGDPEAGDRTPWRSEAQPPAYDYGAAGSAVRSSLRTADAASSLRAQMPDTAIFQTSQGEWDIEFAPPGMTKVGTIKRRADGFLIFPTLPLGGRSSSSIPLGPHRTLEDTMEALAQGLGGKSRLHKQ